MRSISAPIEGIAPYPYALFLRGACTGAARFNCALVSLGVTVPSVDCVANVHGFSGVTGSILSAGLILIVFLGVWAGVGVAVAVFAVVVAGLDPRDSAVAAERAFDCGPAGSSHA